MHSIEKPSSTGKSFNGKRKRVRNWTSDDRAAHRVFEKGRRQAFNDNLIDLARQLPNLASTRRLNKHMIVQESVTRHRKQQELCLAAAMQVQELINERNALLDDLNVWRATQMDLFPPQLPRPVNETLLQNLSELPHEAFGTFPNGFGDNAGGEDQDDLNTDQQQSQPGEAVYFGPNGAESIAKASNYATHLPMTIDGNEAINEEYMDSSDSQTYYDSGFDGLLVPPVFVDLCTLPPQH